MQLSDAEKIFFKNKNPVRFYKEELLFIVWAYQEHLTRQDNITENIQGKHEHSPKTTQDLYENSPVRQLQD